MRSTWYGYGWCFALTFVSASILALTVAGQDWNRFRGPNGSGVAADTDPVPSEFGPDKNLKWKNPLPGAGVSSPIVVGDKVFVTCYSGYGVDRRNPGDQKDLKRHLVCVNRADGKTIWEKTIDPVLPEDEFGGAGVPEHGYASHTPVSDGERIYCFFGKTGVLAFDLDGKELWRKSVGTDSDPRRWGTSSSPIVHENVVIVTAGPESRSFYAFDGKTGEQVWKEKADSLGNVWGSPSLVLGKDGQAELVIGAPYELWGLNPATGQLNWYCNAMENDQFNSSVVVADGVVYAIEGRGAIALKAGGKDDVTKTNVVWNGNYSGRFGSPIVHNGLLYSISGGLANCVNVKDGSKVYEERLATPAAPASPTPAGGQPQRGGGGRQGRGGGGFGGSDYSSPVMADGKIYFVTRSGEIHVIKAGEKFEQLATNRVTTDREDFSATPAISHGAIFIRSNKFLYCVSEK